MWTFLVGLAAGCMTQQRLRVLQGGRRRRRRDRSGAAAFVVGVLLVVVLVAATVSRASTSSSSSTPGSSSTLSQATVAYWDGVAACETGGAWRGLGPVYQGGLGFYSATWDWWAGELGLERRYPDAGDAPRLVQIRVADYGRRVHAGYWGCA
jgi:resuscitation-promoting factor RpfA